MLFWFTYDGWIWSGIEHRRYFSRIHIFGVDGQFVQLNQSVNYFSKGQEKICGKFTHIDIPHLNLYLKTDNAIIHKKHDFVNHAFIESL